MVQTTHQLLRLAPPPHPGLPPPPTLLVSVLRVRSPGGPDHEDHDDAADDDDDEQEAPEASPWMVWCGEAPEWALALLESTPAASDDKGGLRQHPLGGGASPLVEAQSTQLLDRDGEEEEEQRRGQGRGDQDDQLQREVDRKADQHSTEAMARRTGGVDVGEAAAGATSLADARGLADVGGRGARPAALAAATSSPSSSSSSSPPPPPPLPPVGALGVEWAIAMAPPPPGGRATVTAQPMLDKREPSGTSLFRTPADVALPMAKRLCRKLRLAQLSLSLDLPQELLPASAAPPCSTSSTFATASSPALPADDAERRGWLLSVELGIGEVLREALASGKAASAGVAATADAPSASASASAVA